MAVWSEVALSRMQRFGRMDAEYFRPSYQVLFEQVLLCNGERISQIANVTDGIHGSPEIAADGIRYISAKCVKDNEFIIEGCIRISVKQHMANTRTQLRENDVIITTVGTIGNVAVVDDIIIQSNCDRHVGIIRIRDTDSLSPYYLSTFLNSKYGKFQSLRESAGNVQLNLYIRNIGKIVIPRFRSQESTIDNLTKLAYMKRKASKELSFQAQQLLESELGIDKLSFQKPVGYTARFSEIEQSRRFDPEHYSPAFKNLLDHLPSGVKLSPLSSHLSFCQRGKQPNYAKQGLPVINSRHVQPNRVIFEGNRRAAANPISDLQIRFGDVLLNGTGRGTIGRAAPYLQQSEAVPDNHVTILRSPELDPVFISFYLNSIAGQLQVEMHQRGTSGQLELYPFDIKRFLIWEAPEGLQKELRSLYDQAAAMERTSKKLLEEAKTRVEQLIEEAVKS